MKKNSLLVAAVATVIGFSAFKAGNNVNASAISQWFSVDESTENLLLNEDGQPDNCPEVGNKHCALQIRLNEGTTSYPTTLSQALTMRNNGQISFDAELFRP